MDPIDQLLQSYFGSLSKEQIETVKYYFKNDSLEKNQFFVREGKTCDKLSIITTGMVRIFTSNEDGKEITQWIAREHFLLTDISGFFFDRLGRWDMQALTETTLLTITKKDYGKLQTELPSWSKAEKNFIMKCLLMMEDRIFSFLSMNAEERYDVFFKHNEDLFTEVPLQYIASILGMSPETFSRIRKKR